MSTPSTPTTVRPGLFQNAVKLLFVILAFGSLFGFIRGTINGNWMTPFGLVLFITFGLLAVIFQFAANPANLHIVESPKR